MSEPEENLEDQKILIMAQTAELYRLLGMVPSDSTIDVHEPVTHNTMSLSNWLSTTRDSFLKLSLSISKALDSILFKFSGSFSKKIKRTKKIEER